MAPTQYSHYILFSKYLVFSLSIKKVNSLDIIARVVIALCVALGLTVIAIPSIWGINFITIAISLIIASTGIYFLFFADTLLRANNYRLLKTQWSDLPKNKTPHPEYPRPQLVRDRWLNLNGDWQYAIRPKKQKQPEIFDGHIVVPFPIESLLSGTGNGNDKKWGKRVSHKQRLWYKRHFNLDELKSNNENLILHFGGVDWHCEVWINQQYVGEHKGAHDAFNFDITSFLSEDTEQEILVSVWDPCNKGPQPRGKQVNRPGNIYYTPVTGIWQTVWLEPVAKTYIQDLTFTSNIVDKTLCVQVLADNLLPGDKLKVSAFDKGEILSEGLVTNGQALINLPKDKIELWSCESPKCYDLTLEISRDESLIDTVKSYFALRKIELKPDHKGINRLFLNNEPQFQLGLLDQGWWPDGLYTAPSDDALKYDIEMTKAMGFNMIRKHVKVEPSRWYYHCDKLGMLVWQDMPTGDKNILPKQKDIVRSPESVEIFHQELDAMLKQLRFFQSIVCWVPFNEGWGQFDTNNILRKVKDFDPSRLVDGPSGWVDRGEGDMRDYHIYNRKLYVGAPEQTRALAIGEFGGIGHRLPQHMAVTNAWSYNNTKSLEHLEKRYEKLYAEQLLPLIEQGLSAAVYTQTTDVESEINGLMTYDRSVIKIPLPVMRSVHQSVYDTFNLCTRTDAPIEKTQAETANTLDLD